MNLKLDDIDGCRFTFLIKGGRYHDVVVDEAVVAAMQAWIEFLRRRGISRARCRATKSGA